MDRLLSRVDSALRTLTPGSARAERQPPNADPQPEAPLDPGERRHVTGLMRINHTGEVCAQALYQGQASTATLPHVRHAMEAAAREEEDHLSWCDDRIRELGGVPSRLNPLFYAVSYALGAGAGLAGDRWSLGFVSETEHQVVRHLENHLTRLPAGDRRSRAILEQMREDELRHAVTAEGAGGAPLPPPIRGAMTLMSKVMTFTTYRI
jgi:ubiquinone biosynthesis monooxygenase Coq7